MRYWPRTRPAGEGGTETIRLGDPELVIAARADHPAFAPLYERYRDDLLRYCHVCLGDWDDAADTWTLRVRRADGSEADCERGPSSRPLVSSTGRTSRTSTAASRSRGRASTPHDGTTRSISVASASR